MVKVKRTNRRSKDYVGMTIERWSILDIYWNKNIRQAMYICKCACGKESHVQAQHILSGRSKSCGCFKGKYLSIASKNKNKRKPQSAFYTVYYRYAYGAKRRNITFNLTQKYFRYLTSSDCYYCGAHPNSVKYNYGDSYTYNGIDRVNNNKGYSVGNCVACCPLCNKLKGTFTKTEFLLQVKRIYNHSI